MKLYKVKRTLINDMQQHHYPAPSIHSSKSFFNRSKIASYLKVRELERQKSNSLASAASQYLLIFPFYLQFLRLLPSGKPVLPLIHSQSLCMKMPHSSNPSRFLLYYLTSTCMLGVQWVNCEEIFLSFPSTTIRKICRWMSQVERLSMSFKRVFKSIPLLMRFLKPSDPSIIILERQMGIILENRTLPCMPRMFDSPIRSEQLRTAERLPTGRSFLPGLVLNTFSAYFWLGYFSYLRKASGLAPEKDYSCSLMQQSPQKIYEQQSQTSQSFFKENLPFFAFHQRYQLSPLLSSSSKNLRNPLNANISACMSSSRSLRLSYRTTQLGKLLVPSPTATTNFPYCGWTKATDASTTKVSLSTSFLNLRLYALVNLSQVVCFIAREV